MRCNRCGNEQRAGRFCARCGWDLVGTATVEVDPLPGITLADRYEIRELINVGGMGRVYRAVQTALGRDVAIKVVHPHLVSNDEAVSRFLAEARAASRLHHPNVVAVFDFGRAMTPHGEVLYLVMELLTGRSLARIIASNEPMPALRAVRIIRQVLSALGEAHAFGITHRDVKPENIVVSERHGRADHVTMIDFGIATVEGDARLTGAGQLLGTPHYMAPERLNGIEGPSIDLYATSVMLFELLTGRVPFDDVQSSSILLKHATVPRPDPRAVAPRRNIPDVVAEICLRAMSIDVGARFADGAAFVTALDLALGALALDAHMTLLPSGPTDRPTSPPPEFEDDPTQRVTRIDPGGLLGRDHLLAAAWGVLDAGDTPCVLVGPAGSGRTALLEVLAREAATRGFVVVRGASPLPPRNEVGHAGLRAIVAGLYGLAVDDPMLVQGRVGGGALVAAALQALFEVDDVAGARRGLTVREGAELLRAAVRRASEAHHGARVLVAIDDVDALDGASRSVIEHWIDGASAPEATVLLTSTSPPDPEGAATLVAFDVPPLEVETARVLLQREGGAREIEWPEATVGPLFVDELRRWLRTHRDDDPPTELDALVRARVESLPSSHRRVLVALSVLGGGTLRDLTSVLDGRGDAAVSLAVLATAGFVRGDGFVEPAHRTVARVALETVPDATVREMLVRARSVWRAERLDEVELVTFAALRAGDSADLRALVSRAAELREGRGDLHGALSVSSDGVEIARAAFLHEPTPERAEAWGDLAARLAGLWIRDDRAVDAGAVIDDVLERAAPSVAVRAVLIALRAQIAVLRGRHSEADRWRTEALRLAEASGVPSVRARVLAMPLGSTSQQQRRAVFTMASRSSIPPARVRVERR